MKINKPFLPISIIAIILFSLIVQSGLCAKSPLFFDAEREAKTCELENLKARKISLSIRPTEDVVLPSLANSSYPFEYLIVIAPANISNHSSSFTCRLFNHSPPISFIII